MKRRFVIALAAAGIVAVGLVGCSQAPSPSTTPSTTASAPITASAAPGNTSSPSGSTAPSPTATASARFVGGWHVHGAHLDIAATAAKIVARQASCIVGAQHFCSETDTLAVVAGDDTQVTLAVTAVSYTDNTGATVPPNPGQSTAVGDSMQLLWQAPGLLKTTILHGFPGWAGGNPYWCGPGISQINLQLCGA
jgi:hypothetical protein